MKNIGIIFLFLFLSNCSIGQGSYFRINTTGKNSFYNKPVLKNLNKELRNFKRNKEDTAFVYIDDSGGSMVNSYVYIKKKINPIYFTSYLIQKKVNIIRFN